MHLLYFLIKIVGLCFSVFGSIWMAVSLALFRIKAAILFLLAFPLYY